MCGCLFLNVCLCWVFFCPCARLNECVDFCSGCRLSTGGKRSTSWSWWCLDRPVWCSHRHRVTFPVRTSAVSGTAPRRPCLGKHSISTLTYLRSESDFLLYYLVWKFWNWKSLQRELKAALVCLLQYFFLYFPGCGAYWGCKESCYAFWKGNVSSFSLMVIFVFGQTLSD